MSRTCEQVLEAAMALSEAERAELASALWDTVDEEFAPELSDEWKAEIAKRLRAIDAGEVQLLTEKEVNARLREKYGPLFD